MNGRTLVFMEFLRRVPFFEGVRELDAVLKVQEAGNAQTLFSLDLATPLYNPACP